MDYWCKFFASTFSHSARILVSVFAHITPGHFGPQACVIMTLSAAKRPGSRTFQHKRNGNGVWFVKW